MVADGRIFFVQLTPVKLLADPARFAVLHKELFGDEYYLPCPPLRVVDPAVDDAEDDATAPAAHAPVIATFLARCSPVQQSDQEQAPERGVVAAGAAAPSRRMEAPDERTCAAGTDTDPNDAPCSRAAPTALAAAAAAMISSGEHDDRQSDLLPFGDRV
jgi:hypothetical protein